MAHARSYLAAPSSGLRIGYDTLYEDPRHPTGSQDYNERLVKCFSEIITAGKLVAFVSRKNRSYFSGVEGRVEWVTLPYSNERRSLRHLTQQLALPRLAQSHGVDVFFGPGNTLPLRMSVPAVLSVKTMHAFTSPQGLGRSRVLVRRLMQKLSAAKARRVITNSMSNRRDVNRFLNVPLERIDVIPEGLDHTRFFPRKSELVKDAIRRWRLEQPYFLFVSGLWPYKNVETLLHAFARFAAKNQIFTLAIAGKGYGWYEDKLKALSRELRINDSVSFLGRVENVDLPFLYSGATALVLPSRYETFGRVVGEAMACGTPTVSAATSSVIEVVGEAGLLFDPDDVGGLAELLTRLSQDELLRADLATRGILRSKEFTWERTASETVDVLRAAATQT